MPRLSRRSCNCCCSTNFLLVLVVVTFAIHLWTDTTPRRRTAAAVKETTPVTTTTTAAAAIITTTTATITSSADVKTTPNNTKWDPFAKWLKPDEEESLRRAMSALTRAFDASNVTYWVDGGTLIGTYRHLDIVPWDVDADVLVSADDASKARYSLLSLQPHFMFCEEKHGQNSVWRFSSVDGSWLTADRELCKGRRYPYIDVYFFSQNATHIWTSLYGQQSPYVWPKVVVFPLFLRPIGQSQLVPVPCDVGAYLGQEYGKGLQDLTAVTETCWSSPVRDHVVPVSIPCSQLKDRYPFVVRTFGSERYARHEFLVIEKLIFNQQIVRQFVWLKSKCNASITRAVDKIS